MARHLVVTNNNAVAGWVFMAIWIAMLGTFTYIAVRDGGIPEMPLAGAVTLLGFFWLFGLAALLHFVSLPRARLVISGYEVTVTERTPFLRNEERFPTRKLQLLPVTQEKDNEGDPLFVCRIVTPAGRKVALKETGDRAQAEAVYDSVAAAIG